MGLLLLCPPETSPVSGRHSWTPVQIFQLKMKTDAVGMAIFADKGVAIAVIRKVIENLSH
jgi:hypothetical protein